MCDLEKAFDVSYCQWAKAEFRRQFDKGFPLLSTVRCSASLTIPEFISTLPEDEQWRFALALLRGGEHRQAAELCGEPLSDRERELPAVIQPDQFEDKVVKAVLQNLEKFRKDQYDQTRAILRNSKQQREFLMNHIGVGVSEQKSGALVIHSLHREGGGMVGSHEDTFTMSKAEIPHKLATTITEAFRRAS